MKITMTDAADGTRIERDLAVIVERGLAGDDDWSELSVWLGLLLEGLRTSGVPLSEITTASICSLEALLHQNGMPADTYAAMLRELAEQAPTSWAVAEASDEGPIGHG